MITCIHNADLYVGDLCGLIKLNFDTIPHIYNFETAPGYGEGVVNDQIRENEEQTNPALKFPFKEKCWILMKLNKHVFDHVHICILNPIQSVRFATWVYSCELQFAFPSQLYHCQWYEPHDVRIKVKSSKGNPGSTDLISDRLCYMVWI